MKKLLSKFFVCLASAVLSFTTIAATWMTPSPTTIIGGNDRWYFGNTNPVYMHSLWIGGNTGTNGYLYINGILWSNDGSILVLSNSLMTVIGLETSNRVDADRALSNLIANISVTNLGNITVSNITFPDNSILNTTTNLFSIYNAIILSNNIDYLIGLEATKRIDADSALSNLIANLSMTNFNNIAVSNITFKNDGSVLNSTTNLFLVNNAIILSNNIDILIGAEVTNRINADAAISNILNNSLNINSIFSGQVNGYYNNLAVNDLFPTNTVNFNQKSLTNVLDLSLRGPLILTDTTNSYIKFPPVTESLSYQQGILWYDTNTHSLAYFNDATNAIIYIGQSVYVRGKNTSGVIITNGQAVYIKGSTGVHPEFGLAVANTNAYNISNHVVGVAVTRLANNDFGYVCMMGRSDFINTQGFTEGQPVYLSTNAGQLTQQIPDTGYPIVEVGHVLRAHQNQGSILININDLPRSYDIDEQLNREITNRISADSNIIQGTTNFNKITITNGATIAGGLILSNGTLIATNTDVRIAPPTYGNNPTTKDYVDGQATAYTTNAVNRFIYPNGTTNGGITILGFTDAAITNCLVIGTPPNLIVIPQFRPFDLLISNEVANRVGADAALSNSVAQVSTNLIKYISLNNFAPYQAQSITGVVLSVLDNSGTDTDTITIPYVKSNESTFGPENLAQGVTQFIVWTNGYYGRFNISNNHSKLQAGCVIKIGADYYAIGSITNGGAISNSIYITAFLPPNSTQTVSGIYGTQFGDTFLGLGNGSRSDVPLTPYMSGEPFDYTTSSFAVDDLGEWVFVNIINNARQLGGAANPMREYDRVVRLQNNPTNKIGWESCAAFRDSTAADYVQRYRTRDGKRVYAIYQANNPGSTLYISTNGLDTVTQIGTVLPVGYQGTKYWTCLESDRSNTVIYATAGGKVAYGSAGGFGATNMSKSTDGGSTWTVLTNMGARSWSSITTVDGTQIWAVAQFISGASAGGIYASSDGGATCNYTNYASTAAFSPTDIYTADGTNIFIVCLASGGPAGQTANVFGYSTNRGVDWTWNAPFSAALCVRSFLNSREVWSLAGSGNLNLSASTNYFNSTYSPNTNWYPYYKSTFVPRSSYNYNICFAPANPNIGYMIFQINGLNIYKTTDGGQNWTATSSPSTDWQSVATWDGNFVVAINGAATAAGGAGNVYYSTNGGTTWAISPDGQRWCNLKLVMPCSNKVYALASLGGQSGTYLSHVSEVILKADTSDLFFSILGGGIGTSDGNWYSRNTIEFIDATNVLTSTAYNNLSPAAALYPHLLQSRDSGNNWFLPHNMSLNNMQYGSTFNPSQVGSAFPIGIRATTNNIIYVTNAQLQNQIGTVAQYILKYTNNNGIVSYVGIVYTGTSVNPQDIAISPDGTRLYVATWTNNILVSTNSGVSWRTNDTRRNWSSIATADGLTVYACVYGGAIYISTNSIQGTNTFTVLESTSRNYTSIYAPTTNIIIASIANVFGQDFLVSTNAGVNWVTNSSGLTRNWQRVTRIPSDTNNLSYLVMAYGSYLYKTTNLFQSVFIVNTNNYFLSLITDFDMPKLGADTNLLFFARVGNTGPSAATLLKSQGDTYNPTTVAGSLSKIWTTLTTYDGKKLYAFSATQEKRAFQTTASAIEYGYAIDVDSGAYTQFTRDQKAWIGANMPTRNKLYMVTYSDLWQTDFDNVYPTSQFYSVVNSNAVSSQYWIDINDTLATVNIPNDGVSTNLVLFSFSFNNNASYVKWNGSQWYSIATNNAGTWQYWGGSVWSNAYTNSIQAALSDAMSVSSNQMTYTDVTSIPDSGWEAVSGFTTNFNTIYIGVTLSSSFYRNTPSISDFSFNVDKTSGLFSKKTEGTDYNIETTITNNIQTVTKLGTNTVNAIIYYIGNQQ